MDMHNINHVSMISVQSTKQNVLLIDDGSITAEKKIVPDSKLLAGCNEGDVNEYKEAIVKKHSSAPTSGKQCPSH